MGAELRSDTSGVLLWPERRLLAVADLHLEKGTGVAARGGGLLPPYDTRATLERLAAALHRHRPALVLCLGDSFHDRQAAGRLAAEDAALLRSLTGLVDDWVWIAGNHDPEPPAGLGGRSAPELLVGPLLFRHEAVPGAVGEVSGHLHPAATVPLPGRRVRERCFVSDGAKLILPAFGAYAGGLGVHHPAIRGLLGPEFEVHLPWRGRIHRFPSSRLAGC